MLKDLPALKTVSVFEGSTEKADAEPLLWTEQNLANCLGVQNWFLRGRYIETAAKGAILGKINSANGTYYRLCYPMKGFETIYVKEACSYSDVNEATYPQGFSIKKLIFDRAVNLYMGINQSLQTVEINGFGLASQATDITISEKRKISRLTINNKVAQGIMGNLTFECINTVYNDMYPLEVYIDDDVATSTASTITIASRRAYNNPYKNYVAKMDLGKKVGSILDIKGNASLDHGRIVTLIIRNETKVLTLLNVGGMTISGTSVYVPDALVGAYKAATNWIALANNIKPLSLLG